MRPRTYNVDLIRFSCLTLVIKLKERERWGRGFVHPLLWPGESQTPKILRIFKVHTEQHTLIWPSVAGNPHSSQTLQGFVEGLEEISTRAGAQRPNSPIPSAHALQDLHQSRWTGHLVPGTVVLSLYKTLASFLYCAAHVLIHDVGAPVPGVERRAG